MTTATDTQAARFTPKELPYAYDALAPHISEETLRFHHDKHYTGYVNKLNELVVGTPYEGLPLEAVVLHAEGPVYNNAAQAWNHEFYFEALSPSPEHRPEGALAKAIDRSFGSFDKMKEAIDKSAVGLFGSGWTWLVADGEGNLKIVNTPNAGNPMTEGLNPLLCVDVWEHAYYIDYRNRRADAVKAFWETVDWRIVGERYAKR